MFKKFATSVGVALSTLLLVTVFTPGSALAQRTFGAIGIGAQVGSPTGLTLKVYRPGAMTYDLAAAWDLDNFLFLNGHGLYERHINRNETVHFYAGPGAFIGFEDRKPDDDIVAGASGQFGLNVILERWELFGQLTPRLELIPETDAVLGASVGLRYYVQ